MKVRKTHGRGDSGEGDDGERAVGTGIDDWEPPDPLARISRRNRASSSERFL